MKFSTKKQIFKAGDPVFFKKDNSIIHAYATQVTQEGNVLKAEFGINRIEIVEFEDSDLYFSTEEQAKQYYINESNDKNFKDFANANEQTAYETLIDTYDALKKIIEKSVEGMMQKL